MEAEPHDIKLTNNGLYSQTKNFSETSFACKLAYICQGLFFLSVIHSEHDTCLRTRVTKQLFDTVIPYLFGERQILLQFGEIRVSP